MANNLRVPYIIAEMSGNHNQDINRAFKIMEEAKKAGADAIKLQTYTADTLTIDHDSEDFQVGGGTLWDGNTLHKLYQIAYTPWDWQAELFKKGEELGITVFSTPFDNTAVDFLEKLNPPIYKIASFEMVDHALIKYVAKTGKPMIISCGMATEEEIGEAIEAAKSGGCKDLTILHCISEYPALVEDCNLQTMVDMKKKFGVNVGLSDHTMGTAVAVAAVALGATVVEKHFTLSRAEGGVDSAFSLEPHELKQLVDDTKIAHDAVGEVKYGPRGEKEKAGKVFRRSLYIVKDIKAGEEFTSENVRSIRPGYGIAPKHIDNVIGKKAKSDLKYGTALKFDHIEGWE